MIDTRTLFCFLAVVGSLLHRSLFRSGNRVRMTPFFVTFRVRFCFGSRGGLTSTSLLALQVICIRGRLDTRFGDLGK
ncbi:hypothetical protein DFJ77DRAFT_448512 [Powellomyces hirtus]|nr:hypothetical protein DFJ77DRAFT_448512 [Powellomyces hirtus]